MTVDAAGAASRERRIARRLEARGFPGLAEALVRLDGVEVGRRFRLDALYAVGAEGAVYTATDLRRPTAPPSVAKLPLVPYNRPGELSSTLLRHRRAALRDEADHLARSLSPYMPASRGLHEFVNPLLDPARGGAFEEPDPVLVMERLPGRDMDLWLARLHASRVPRRVLGEHLDRIAVTVLDALNDLEERGFLYADLRPGNLRVHGRPRRFVRLLDAGSLVAAGARDRFPHVPHYLPPALFEARYVRDQPIVPSPSVLAVMAGRVLHEVATGRVPVPGEPLDAAALRQSGVSGLVADVVDGLAAGGFPSIVSALRYLERRGVRRPLPPPRRPAPAWNASASPAPAAPAAPVAQRVEAAPAIREEPPPIGTEVAPDANVAARLVALRARARRPAKQRPRGLTRRLAALLGPIGQRLFGARA